HPLLQFRFVLRRKSEDAGFGYGGLSARMRANGKKNDAKNARENGTNWDLLPPARDAQSHKFYIRFDANSAYWWCQFPLAESACPAQQPVAPRFLGVYRSRSLQGFVDECSSSICSESDGLSPHWWSAHCFVQLALRETHRRHVHF